MVHVELTLTDDGQFAIKSNLDSFDALLGFLERIKYMILQQGAQPQPTSNIVPAVAVPRFHVNGR